LDKYDIDEVYFADELLAWIQSWSAHCQGSLYVLHANQVPPVPFSGGVDASSFQPAANLARMIKDEHEIKLIRKANDISSEAHKQVLANILKFKNEAQVEGLFLDVCISNQAKQQAYDPIAASGTNAGTLHYDANNEDFEDRQLMCLDAGCEFELYASDITRTFPLSGSWPSIEAENIYKLVERMQETCIKRLAPGVRYLDLHILAHHIAIDGLLRLGILFNGTIEEIYKAGTSRAFFPHGLGHHVGLEVHDVGQKELMSLYERDPRYEKVSDSVRDASEKECSILFGRDDALRPLQLTDVPGTRQESMKRSTGEFVYRLGRLQCIIATKRVELFFSESMTEWDADNTRRHHSILKTIISQSTTKTCVLRLRIRKARTWKRAWW
jgi:hypothetical protein